MINDRLSTTSRTSRVLSGVALAVPGSKAQNSLIAAQVIDVSADGETWVVTLEAGINTPTDGVVFTMIGQFEKGDEVLLSTFPIASNLLYRFRLSDDSTGSVIVRLAG